MHIQPEGSSNRPRRTTKRVFSFMHACQHCSMPAPTTSGMNAVETGDTATMIFHTIARMQYSEVIMAARKHDYDPPL